MTPVTISHWNMIVLAVFTYSRPFLKIKIDFKVQNLPLFSQSLVKKMQSLITSQKQIKKAYHTHSSFLAKHHIDGIVAMLDVSNVDNECVCLKRSSHIRSGFMDTIYKVQFLPLHWYGD